MEKYLEFNYYFDNDFEDYVTVISPIAILSGGKICNKAKMYMFSYGLPFGKAEETYATYLGIKQYNKFNIWDYFNYLIDDENGIEVEENGIQYIFFKYFDDLQHNFKEYWCVKKIVQGQDLSTIHLNKKEWWEYMITNSVDKLELNWNKYPVLDKRLLEEMEV